MHNELETPSRYKTGSVAMLTPPQEREEQREGRKGEETGWKKWVERQMFH